MDPFFLESSDIEGIKELWQPKKMSYTVENYFFALYSSALDRKHREDGEKESWKPEYDEMCLSFLTPKERKDMQAKGATTRDIIAKAKDEMVTAMWTSYKTSESKRLGDSEAEMKTRMNDREIYKKEVFDKDVVKNTFDALVFKEGLRNLKERDYTDGRDDLLNPKEKKPSLARALIGRIKKVVNPSRDTEKPEVNRLKTMLQGCTTGKRSLAVLNERGYAINFDLLGFAASSINPEKKTITLNQLQSEESHALSLVNAACVLKQEKNGAGKSPETMAIRKADALTTQMIFADEMILKNPKIMETFKANGNEALCDAYCRTFSKEHERQAAVGFFAARGYLENLSRSAAVDCYLTAVLPSNKPSFEMINDVCRDFKGYHYYSDKNSMKDKIDLYTEKSFNAVLAAKAKQAGR